FHGYHTLSRRPQHRGLGDWFSIARRSFERQKDTPATASFPRSTLLPWQNDAKFGPLLGVAQRDLSAVCLDNPPSDRQTAARSVPLGRVETLDGSGPLLRADSRSIVPQRQAQGSSPLVDHVGATNGHLNRVGTGGERILKEVAEDLPQPEPTADVV